MTDHPETLEEQNRESQEHETTLDFDEQQIQEHPIHEIHNLELNVHDKLSENQIDKLGEEVTGLQTTIQNVDQVLHTAETSGDLETIQEGQLHSVDHYVAWNLVGSFLGHFRDESQGDEIERKKTIRERNVGSFEDFAQQRQVTNLEKNDRENKLMTVLSNDQSDFAIAYRQRFMKVLNETKNFRLESNQTTTTTPSSGLTWQAASKKGLVIAAGVGLAVTLGNRLIGGKSFKESVKKGGIRGGISGLLGGGLSSFFSLPPQERNLEGLRNAWTGEIDQEPDDESNPEPAADSDVEIEEPTIQTEDIEETEGETTDETQEELETQSDEEDDPEGGNRTAQDTANTALGATGSAGLGYGAERYRQRTIENSLETDLEYDKTRSFLNSLSDDYARKGSPDNAKLTPAQRAAYQRASERFDQLSQTTQEEFKSISIYKRMLKEGIMTPDDLYQLDISPQNVGPLLRLLQTNSELAEQLAGLDDLDQIKQLLAKNGISDLPDGILTVILKAKQVNDILDTLTVFKYAKTIRHFGRFGSLLKVAIQTGRLDALMIGVDRIFYKASMSQAKELDKINGLRADILRSRAKRHLGIAIGGASMTMAIGIAGALAAAGPPGWIILVAGVAIGGLTAGLDAAIDASYFDILDVYHYNENDYNAIVAKHSVKVRDFIVGMAHGINIGDVTINDNGRIIALEILFPPYAIAKEIGFDTSLNIQIDDEVKNTSMQAARKALIGFELAKQENEDGTKKYPILYKYLSAGLSPTDVQEHEKEQYIDQQKKLASEVQKTYEEYTKQFIPTHEDDPRADNLLNSQGHEFINQKVGESVSWHLSSTDESFEYDGNSDSKLSAFREHKKQQLLLENKDTFDLREKNRSDDEQFRRKYHEFYLGAKAYQNSPNIELSDDQKKNRNFVQSYFDYKSLVIPGEKRTPDYSAGIMGFHDRNFQLIDKQLSSLDIEGEKVERSDSAMRYHLTQGQLQEKLNSKIRSTKDFFINYLLEVARQQGYEIYDETELLSYFNGQLHDMGSHTGYQFKKKRFQSQAEWIISIDDEFGFQKDLQNLSASDLYEKYFQGSKDTAHENADAMLQKEFDQNNIAVLENMISYRDKKNILLDEISNLPSGEAPGRLIYQVNLHDSIHPNEKIGPVELFVFSYDEDGGLLATTSFQYRDRVLDIPGIKLRYIDNVREELSEREQEYIEEVNFYKTQLDELLQSHDFKLPERYVEHHIKEHIQQRNQLQISLLSSTPQEARFALEQKRQYYRDYFSNTYTGILLAASGNMMSRRVNTGQQITQIDQFVTSGWYSIEDGNIEINEGVLEWFGITGTSLKLKEEVTNQLNTYKIDQFESQSVSEIIQQAYSTTPPNEALLEKAKRSANLVLTACLQANIAYTNSSGKIYGIKQPNKKFYKTEVKLDALFSRTYFDEPLLDQTGTGSNINHELVITRTFRKHDQLFFQETERLKNNIEDTNGDQALIDRNLHFDNETATLFSHNHEISLNVIAQILLGDDRSSGYDDGETMINQYMDQMSKRFGSTIIGTSEELNQQIIKQTLYTANIINFCKKYISPIDLTFVNSTLYNKTDRIYLGTAPMIVAHRLKGAGKKILRGVDGVEIVSKKSRKKNAPIMLGNTLAQKRFVQSFQSVEESVSS